MYFRRPPASGVLADDHGIQSDFSVADAGDSTDEFKSLNHLAEDGVLVIQPGGFDLGDEELASVGVGAGVGHGQKAGLIKGSAAAEFVGELIAGASDAAAEGISSLNHEIGNDPVENSAVIELGCRLLARAGISPLLFTAGEGNEVFHRLGRVFGQELDLDGSCRGVESGVESLALMDEVSHRHDEILSFVGNSVFPKAKRFRMDTGLSLQREFIPRESLDEESEIPGKFKTQSSGREDARSSCPRRSFNSLRTSG